MQMYHLIHYLIGSVLTSTWLKWPNYSPPLTFIKNKGWPTTCWFIHVGSKWLKQNIYKPKWESKRAKAWIKWGLEQFDWMMGSTKSVTRSKLEGLKLTASLTPWWTKLVMQIKSSNFLLNNPISKCMRSTLVLSSTWSSLKLSRLSVNLV